MHRIASRICFSIIILICIVFCVWELIVVTLFWSSHSFATDSSSEDVKSIHYPPLLICPKSPFNRSAIDALRDQELVDYVLALSEPAAFVRQHSVLPNQSSTQLLDRYSQFVSNSGSSSVLAYLRLGHGCEIFTGCNSSMRVATDCCSKTRMRPTIYGPCLEINPSLSQNVSAQPIRQNVSGLAGAFTIEWQAAKNLKDGDDTSFMVFLSSGNGYVPDGPMISVQAGQEVYLAVAATENQLLETLRVSNSSLYYSRLMQYGKAQEDSIKRLVGLGGLPVANSSTAVNSSAHARRKKREVAFYYNQLLYPAGWYYVNDILDELLCTRYRMHGSCGCIPFYAARAQNDSEDSVLPVCGLSTTQLCVAQFVLEAIEDCRRQRQHFWSYSASVSTKALLNNERMRMVLYHSQLRYAVLAERQAHPFMDMLHVIANVLLMYLAIAACCALLIYCLECCWRLRKPRSTSVGSQRVSTARRQPSHNDATNNNDAAAYQTNVAIAEAEKGTNT